MNQYETKEMQRMIWTVSVLTILLIAGLTLIACSLIQQDNEIQRDMEEYAALAEHMAAADTPKPSFYPAETEAPEKKQRLSAPVPSAESVNGLSCPEGQPQPQAKESAQNTSQNTVPGAIILVLPNDERDERPLVEAQEDQTEKQRPEYQTRETAASLFPQEHTGIEPPIASGRILENGQRPSETASTDKSISASLLQTESPTTPETAEAPQTTPAAAETSAPATAIATLQPTPSPAPTPRIGKTGVDLDACKTQNADFVGWLKIPGTKISYPVVWTDRVDYYLTHTFSGKESKVGTLFSLGKTDYKTPGKNIAIYGHHITTSGGNMFQPLMSYKKQNFYQSHKTVYFDTLYDLGEYTVFAVINMRNSEWDPSKASFTNEADFLAFVSRAKAAALYDTGVEVTAKDHILTLITCDRDYHNPDGRLIVMAVKQ